MKKFNFVLCLLTITFLASCVFSGTDEAIGEADKDNLFIQDVKFKMDEDLGKLSVNFFITAKGREIKESLPITIKILDKQLKETGFSISANINENKRTIPVNANFQEELLISVPSEILLKGEEFYLDITIKEIPFPRVHYIYIKINIPDWEDVPIIGV